LIPFESYLITLNKQYLNIKFNQLTTKTNGQSYLTIYLTSST